jgi:hypothetical protein
VKKSEKPRFYGQNKLFFENPALQPLGSFSHMAACRSSLENTWKIHGKCRRKYMFPEENIDEQTRNTFCYSLPLKKRHHLPIKVFKTYNAYP